MCGRGGARARARKTALSRDELVLSMFLCSDEKFSGFFLRAGFPLVPVSCSTSGSWFESRAFEAIRHPIETRQPPRPLHRANDLLLRGWRSGATDPSPEGAVDARKNSGLVSARH